VACGIKGNLSAEKIKVRETLAQIHHTPHWPQSSAIPNGGVRSARHARYAAVACGTLGGTACHRRQLSGCCCCFLCTIGDVARRVTFWPIYSRIYIFYCLLKCRQGMVGPVNPFGWPTFSLATCHMPHTTTIANMSSSRQRRRAKQIPALESHSIVFIFNPNPSTLTPTPIRVSPSPDVALQLQFWLPHYKYNINFYVFIFSNASVNTHTHTQYYCCS